MEKIVDYFSTHTDEYFMLLGQHIGISILTTAIAILIAVPLGVLCSKKAMIQKVFERFFGLLRIVPSLAILMICLPILGTGIKPAVVALVILAVPPILMNTTQAFLHLPAATIEAATAMGMGKARIFFRVKLPLAFPLMYAGIRTAIVEVIASATLASYIGAGGLGNIIFTGLGLMRVDLLYIGGGSVAILSLLTGFVMDRIYQSATKYQRI
ncbi:MAG: ABC transporter permease [Lachnospiraceae bacterium]|nr:ABC transporter permease [Lachnospiraceae bacterium]